MNTTIVKMPEQVTAAQAEIDGPVFEGLRQFLANASGFALTKDKAYLVESRLTRVATMQGFTSVRALAVALASGSANAATQKDVVEAMTTNETSFFRDTGPFRALKDIVLPAVTQATPGRQLRILSAAASTGQESYSIAMILREEGQTRPGAIPQIIGIDIDSTVLAKASAGIYTQYEVQRGISTPLLMKYFNQVGSAWHLRDEIKQMTRFQQFNLLHAMTPLGRFDIVFCRNVLIYFDTKTKAATLEKLVGLIQPGGFLFLGGTESATGFCSGVVQVPSVAGLYRKTA